MLVNSQIHCINYTIDNGLPEESINCATEDKNGYMWFGGQSGIYRFDGIEFVNFGEKGSGNRPRNIRVLSLEVDAMNNIWAGSFGQGIFKYNSSRNHWTNYALILQENGEEKLQEVNSILVSSNEIWFNAKNIGLGKIELASDTILNFSFDHLPNISSWKNLSLDMKFSPQDSNQIYLAAQGNIISFNINNKSFSNLGLIETTKIFGTDFPYAPSSTVITKAGRIFASGWIGGVVEFDPKENKYISRNPKGWKAENIWRAKIFKSDSKYLWVTFRIKGIGKYDFEKNEWTIYEAEAFNRSGLLKGEYNSIYESKNKEIWVMTSKGISHVVPSFQSFKYYEGEKKNANYFTGVVYHKASNQFITSYSGNYAPIKTFDSNFNLQDSFFTSRNNWSSVHNLMSYEDTVFCVSDRILEFNYSASKFESISIPGFSDYVGNHNFIVESDHWLWVMLGNHQLVHFNTESKEVKAFEIPQYQGIGKEKVIYGNIELINNEIWIPANSELVIFDIRSERFSHYNLKGQKFTKLKSNEIGQTTGNAIQQVIPKLKGKCWVTTNTKGIFLVESNSEDKELTVKKNINFEQIPALVDLIEMIDGIDEDYWIATNSGLVHLEKNLNTFRVYGQREGLIDPTLSQGLTRINDHLFVGITKGFAKIDLNTLLKDESQINLFIDIAKVDTFNLLNGNSRKYTFKQNNFYCKVSAPYFSNPRRLTYSHRLIGLSNDWQETNAEEKQFRYEELPPGSYEFEVKAKVGSEAWSRVERINFDISPPWWNTWWFRVLAILALLSSLFTIYRIRLRAKMRQVDIEKKMAQLVNQSLRAQMNPHFVFNALNSIKSLILLDRKDEGINYLTQFSRMVREILAISKETFISLERELELLDLYLEMESLRFTEKFNYKFQIDSMLNTREEKIPPLLLQPYVENAIWHGLLHKEGPANLLISVDKQEKFIEIIIEDNGVGRALASRSKSAFSKYKTESRGTAINKDRINLLGLGAEVNIIDLKDQERAIGTRVIIKIPSNQDKNDKGNIN